MQAPPALNDENSSSTASVLRTNNKPGAPPLQPSARKAFGSISSNLSKQPPARRALGDISNSAAKPPAGPTASKGASSLFAPPQKAAAAAAPAPPAAPAATGKASSSGPASTEQATTSTTTSSTPAWWEGLEPERTAGKTWEQQLAEEDAALDAEAKAAADQVWQAVFKGGSGMFGFLSRPLSKAEEEEDSSYPLVEAPSRQLQGPCNLAPLPDVSLEELTYPSDYDFASLLPDINVDDAYDDDDSGEGDSAGQTSTAEEVQQLTESLAAASIKDCGGVGSPSSPSVVGVGGSSGQQQQSSQDCCMSPEVLPW